MGRLTLRAESCCVVIVDLQNDFLDPHGHFPALGWWSESYEGLVERVRTFRDALPRAVRRVYTGTVYEPDGSDAVVARHRILPEQFHEGGRPRGGPVLVRGTWGAQLVEALKPDRSDPVIAKRRYSAFHGTELETLLRCWRVDTVLLAGVNAEQCVEATARDAFVRDFDVVLVADCIGSWSAERLEASKRLVAFALGAVADSRAVLEALSS